MFRFTPTDLLFGALCNSSPWILLAPDVLTSGSIGEFGATKNKFLANTEILAPFICAFFKTVAGIFTPSDNSRKRNTVASYTFRSLCNPKLLQYTCEGICIVFGVYLLFAASKM